MIIDKYSLNNKVLHLSIRWEENVVLDRLKNKAQMRNERFYFFHEISCPGREYSAVQQ